jgi:hypothetical protein
LEKALKAINVDSYQLFPEINELLRYSVVEKLARLFWYQREVYAIEFP